MGVPQTQRAQVSRVLQLSEETRMRAIQGKISLVSTFCTTVELDVQFGEMWRAKDLLNKLGLAINSLTAHINDPAHVSDKTIKQEFRRQLAQVRQRVTALYSQVEQHQSHEPPAPPPYQPDSSLRPSSVGSTFLPVAAENESGEHC